MPDFNIRDTDGQTVLSFCLWNGNLNLAKKLIRNIYSFRSSSIYNDNNYWKTNEMH